MLLTILLFVLILSIVVLTHEFGHFYVAKKSGMRVDEFGFGFPPRVFGFKRGETLYSINLFPIGGFVKIHGEDGKDKEDPRSFGSKPLWVRSFVIVAGVAMNFLVAFVLFSAVSAIGTPTLLGDEPIVENGGALKEIYIMVLDVAEGSPAEVSGIKQGDKIVELFYNEEVLQPETGSEVRGFINSHRGNEIILSVSRAGEILKTKILSRPDFPRVLIASVREKKSFFGSEVFPAFEAGLKKNDKILSLSSGEESLDAVDADKVYDFIKTYKSNGIIFALEREEEIVEISIPPVENPEGLLGITFSEEGPTGLAFARMGTLQYSPLLALLEGGKTTYTLTVMSISVFGQTLKSAATEREIPEGVAGPLGIAAMTGTVRNMGLIYVLHFVALISLSLGIINMVPFPALDGGRFMFLVIEKIKGSPLNVKIEGYANTIGFALLILLIIIITYSDINKLF